MIMTENMTNTHNTGGGSGADMWTGQKTDAENDTDLPTTANNTSMQDEENDDESANNM